MDEHDLTRLATELDIGKQLPSAVYLHRSLVKEAPKALADLVFRISDALNLDELSWNVVKIHRDWPRLSFLRYPEFDTEPYPVLEHSKIVDLARKSVRDMSFIDDANPPILHRKELLVPDNYPGREEFQQITEEGESAGLYDDPRRIGFKKNWEALIASKGYEIVDARLFRTSALVTPTSPEIRRDRTAISRTQLSAPMQLLSRLGYLEGQYSICDYGCGRGDDLAILESLGVDAVGWDPNHRPEGERLPSAIVNLGFVINVIEDREERDQALTSAYALAEKALIVSAMIATDAHIAKFKPYKDGVITSRNTFQKYYDQSEMQEYIDQTLGVSSVPAAGGVFLVFKDEEFEAAYRFARYGRPRRERHRVYKRTRAEKLRTIVEENYELCEGYWAKSLDRGRWLNPGEFADSHLLVGIFGTVRNAKKALLEVFDNAELTTAEKRREEEMVFSQAMAHFQGRSPFSKLPKDLRTDIRYFFQTYRGLQQSAQTLLSSLTETEHLEADCVSLVEKLPVYLEKGKALTVPACRIGELPLKLRSYIGCAEQLIGEVQQFDLVKIHIHTGKVSVMKYKGFDGNPLPELVERVKVDLWNQRVHYYDYVDEFKPKPLYWRSYFMDMDDDRFKKQRSFDTKLDELGLAPEVPHFGFSFDQLNEILSAKGLEIRGHRFYKRAAVT